MSEYMHRELLFFCHTFLAGVCMAACYDMLKIFRNLVQHSWLRVTIEDICYWCIAGLFLFSVIYQENDGVIRIYSLFSAGTGALTYRAGPGRVLVKWITAFLAKVKNILGIPVRHIIMCRKRLKFRLNRVRISLCEHKSIQKVRKRRNEEKKED